MHPYGVFVARAHVCHIVLLSRQRVNWEVEGFVVIVKWDGSTSYVGYWLPTEPHV
jgi:hypothetical protein